MLQTATSYRGNVLRTQNFLFMTMYKFLW